jgi:hypothetical protein
MLYNLQRYDKNKYIYFFKFFKQIKAYFGVLLFFFFFCKVRPISNKIFIVTYIQNATEFEKIK